MTGTPIGGFDDVHTELDDRLRMFRANAVADRRRRARSSLSTALVILDLAMMGLAVVGVHGPARVAVGLAFCLAVPGWSIVGLLRLHDTALEVGLTMAASLASLLVLAQLAISVGGWHLLFLQLLVCLACLPSLLYQAAARSAARGTSS